MIFYLDSTKREQVDLQFGVSSSGSTSETTSGASARTGVVERRGKDEGVPSTRSAAMVDQG